MKLIPLSGKWGRGLFTIIDDRDYRSVIPYKWHGEKKKLSKTIYVSTKIKRNIVTYLHRFITNAKTGEEIDHVDMNGLNNCRSNLRIVNKSQNMRNTSIRSDNTSGYKGVFKIKYGKHNRLEKWCACIHINGKPKRLGNFWNKKDAALAYNKGAKKYYGEFARLNNILS